MKKHQKKMLCATIVCFGLAIVVGAFGAHGLEKYFHETGKEVFSTGSRYQFYAVFAMLGITVIDKLWGVGSTRTAFNWMFLGMILFSGSLYLLSVKNHIAESLIKIVGPLTPLGGLMMIISSVILLVGVLRKETDMI